MGKILSIIHQSVFGGPHNNMLQINEGLAKKGWETLILLPDEPGPAADRLRAGNVQVIQIPLHRLRKSIDLKLQLSFIRNLDAEMAHIQQVIRENKINVVQICGLMNPQDAIAAHREGIPVVWQILGTTAPMTLRLLLMPIVTRLADVIMVTGLEVARVHPGALGFKDRLISFFPPVDTIRFRPDPICRARAREEMGIPQDAVLVGTVGNRNKLKGHDVWIRSAAILRQAYSSVFFRILGGDTPTHAKYYQRAVVEESQRLGLMTSDRFRIIDPGNRVAELLPALDIFLLTSRAEGIPTVILEAMASGVPVVTTRVGSVNEAVEHGVTGLIVDRADPKQIAQAIAKLIDSPQMRAEMGEASRRRALERFDSAFCADIYSHAYSIAVAHHSSRHQPDFTKSSF
jgi:glycosyltransferase involved in cell wall biosynthesis